MSISPQRDDWLQVGRGLLMGGADIIPGVSGGTIALVLGIYEQLVTAISHVDGTFLAFVAKRQWSAAARHVNLRFLIPLGLGIGLGIISLASLMHTLLVQYRPLTLAAFFGLIFASSLLVGRLTGASGQRRGWLMLAFGAAGAAAALWLVTRTPITAQAGLGYTFVCGAVAICAMILPGISGAYILLLLGKYVYVTGIVKKLPRWQASSGELIELVVFAAGCAVGLILFSKFLRLLLARWHGPTMATLCGFMLGSLYKVWPFQIDQTPDVVDFGQKRFEPIWPAAIDRTVVACAVIAVAAAAAVLLLDQVARKPSRLRA